MSRWDFFNKKNLTKKYPPKNEVEEGALKIPKPTSQVQECLYLLLTNKFLTRKDFMDKAYIMNSPACILILRNKNIGVDITFVNKQNKFGRDIKVGYYSLQDKEKARYSYIRLVEKSNMLNKLTKKNQENG